MADIFYELYHPLLLVATERFADAGAVVLRLLGTADMTLNAHYIWSSS